MVFNLYLNEPNYKSKIVNTQSANALPKTNTSTSSIIKTATTLPLPANHGSTNRLLALKTNALASEKKSLANTWVPKTHMQVGQYYQTEKNSINRASRVANSAGSNAPPSKYFKRKLF